MNNKWNCVNVLNGYTSISIAFIVLTLEKAPSDGDLELSHWPIKFKHNYPLSGKFRF